MIDPLNIFQEIKGYLEAEYDTFAVAAFGSRVSGKSGGGKWDFDVLLVFNGDLLLPQHVQPFIRAKFVDRFDENNKPVKVDISTIPVDKFKILKENPQYFRNGHML